ncbi:MAG: efflux RND transporter permease subunit [Gammaproteobacteria bacterium]|nr:efflux RND transporter permease subunit [Gammaproteobacteria bacterium]
MKSNDELLSNKHSFLNWFINNPVTANLIMIATLGGGLYMVGFFGLFGTTSKIPLEALPLIESNVITVHANLNGATPEDVESGVTQKIEQSLQGIQGIEKIMSQSRENLSLVQITAKPDYDIDKLLRDVKSNVDGINSLPSETENIIVAQNKRRQSILWVTLYGDVSEFFLKKKAHELRDKLLASPYVEEITISGEKSSEVTIEVSESKLNEYNITITEIATAIRQSSLDLSTGDLATSRGNVTLRIKNQAHNKDDYANITVRMLPDGSTVKLRDIASISDGLSEQNVMSEFNGKPSLTLRLSSGENANVIEADEAATTIVDKFSKTLPAHLKTEIWNNRVIYVRDRINLFARNATTGVLLVFLLLTLFLNLRLAFWVALGIPISFAGALLMMGISGLTINLITLFGFIMVLGIVVDDAIVIGESIYSWKKRTNNAPNATLTGVTRVSTAATFGVLTTIAAFLPLTQIAGEVGKIISQIGWVVIFCLLFSLIESKLILPSHLRKINVSTQVSKKGPWSQLQSAISQGLEVLVEKAYLPMLSSALRQRYFTLLIFIALFILAIGTLLGGILKFYRFPIIESQNISLTVDMDETVSVDMTQNIARKASKALRKTDEQLITINNSEDANVVNIATFNKTDTSFTINAVLAGAETRTISAPEIVSQWRKNVGLIEGSKSVKFSSRRRFSEADIEIQLFADDYQKQLLASKELQKILGGFDGVKDIHSSEDDTNKEIHITMKPSAAMYGVNETSLAKAVRAAFYGIEVERLQRGNEEIKVIVKYPKQERESLSHLKNLWVPTANGSSVPISEVATLTFSESASIIKRINSKRAVIVYANVTKRITSSEDILAALEETTFDTLKQKYAVDITLGGEAEDGAKSDKSMITGFIVSLALIYALLAIPLKSYSKPIIIMSVIPFGIIGAIGGHLLLGMNVSTLGMFGVIALSGVVVNDSLLLINTIQQHRDEGHNVFKSIQITGVRRFRPIILTSITTFVGLVPLLFETSFQAQFLIPMAVSLGFGILFATMITLILVPVIYCIFDDIKHVFFKQS